MKKTTKNKTKNKAIQIGVVGVDSGKIVITDPTYIDTEWKNEELEQTPAIIKFPNGKKEEVISCSPRWFELIERINSGELKMIENNGFAKAKHNFSYPACTNITLTEGYGQLNYKHGHAVKITISWGDGCYPVYATIDKKTGRVKELKIVFF